MPKQPEPARRTETLAQELSANDFIQEFRAILQEGWTPDLEEFLTRVPEPIRAETEQAVAALLAERELDNAGAGKKPRVRSASAELKSWSGGDGEPQKERADDEYVRDYMDLLDEGLTPDLDEYLDMVPESKRDAIRAAIGAAVAEREADDRAAATRAKVKTTAAEFEALAGPATPPVTIAGLVGEYEGLLDQGLIPDIDEFLSRLPETLHAEARGRIEAALDARGLRLGGPVLVTPEAEQIVAEYARLLDEGWRPEIEEYLARVPAGLRDEVEPEVRRLREAADAAVAAAERETGEALAAVADEVCDREESAEADDAAPAEEPAAEAESGPADTEDPLALLDVAAESEPDAEPEAEPEGEAPAADPEHPPELLVRDATEEVVEAGPEELAALFATAEAGAPGPAPVDEPVEASVEAELEAALEEPVAAALDEPVEEVVEDVVEVVDVVEEDVEEPAEVVEAAPPPVVPGLRHEQDLGERAFLAHDEARARYVVAKRFRPGTPDDVQQAALAEAKRAGALGDETIVAGDLLAKNALVSEFVEGEPIDVAAPQLPYDRRARLLARAARALAAAHDAGIPHLGLAPERVLVTTARNVRIVGFGFGAIETGREDAYAAPEQIDGGEIWQPADVFSFGAVMYAALTGRAPFAPGTVEQIRSAMAKRTVFPRELDARIPEDLQAVCLSCLHRNPAHRPSMAEVADALDRFDAGRPVRLRPNQYRSVVRAGVRAGRSQLDLWQQQGLATADERDDLDVVYRRVSDREEHWRFDAWRVTPRRVALYAGGTLVAAAMTVFVWLGGAGIVPAVAAVVLLGAGVLARQRGDFAAACAFLGAGSVAAAPAAYTFYPDPAAAAGVGLVLSLAALAWLRVALFAWTTAALVAAGVGGLAHRFGFMPAGYAALAALLPASLAFPRASWAQPFRWMGTLAVLGAPLLLRAHVPAVLGTAFLDPWLVVLALHGVVLIALQALFERTAHLDLRRTARVFEWAGVGLLLGAMYANALAYGSVLALAAYTAAPVALLVLAPWRRRGVFLICGLLGLAAACYLPLAAGVVAAGTFAASAAGAGGAVALGAFFLAAAR